MKNSLSAAPFFQVLISFQNVSFSFFSPNLLPLAMFFITIFAVVIVTVLGKSGPMEAHLRSNLK